MTAHVERLAILGMLLGFVVLVLPIAVTVGSVIALWNHILTGGAILLLSRYVAAEATDSPTRASVAAGVSGILGGWLAASAVVYPAGIPLAFWTKVVAGGLLFAIGVVSVQALRPLDISRPAAAT